MSKKEILININHSKFKKLAESCTTKIELHTKLDVPVNGTYARIINKLMVDTTAKLKPKKLKYKLVKKTCPVCGDKFDAYENHPREKTTCSHGCSNTYFRTGHDNGNFQGKNYRTVCFIHHKKECIICGENRIVGVHHYDGNHDNNEPTNLIPVCPTHHNLYHSRYRDDVAPAINEYHKTFKQSYGK